MFSQDAVDVNLRRGGKCLILSLADWFCVRRKLEAEASLTVQVLSRGIFSNVEIPWGAQDWANTCDLKWKVIAKSQLWRKRLECPSGEADLGLWVCPCSKDGQPGPRLSHKMPHLWRSSCAPPAQTGSLEQIFHNHIHLSFWMYFKEFLSRRVVCWHNESFSNYALIRLL